MTCRAAFRPDCTALRQGDQASRFLEGEAHFGEHAPDPTVVTGRPWNTGS